MTNFKYLQKMFFLLVMGFSMSLLCVACGDDEEDPINEEDVTPPSKDDVVTPPSEDILKAVDLGLSVKWASCNVGATDVNLHGSYFAWGEIKEKEEYTEENSATYGKYFMNNIYGDAQYDAARAVWGSEWRLPTKYEMQELIENCAWTWTSEGIFNGYRVTSFRTGESIFLPAAGSKGGNSLSGANSLGSYWTSTPFEQDSCYSYVFNINSDDNYLSKNSRYRGYSIRPVMGEPTLLYVPKLSPYVGLSDYIVTALTVSATLWNDGGSPVTERGFCISSTSEEPTTADRKVVSTSEGPDFSATIDGLAEGGIYHIRAYAVNAKGVGYGETRTFSTQTIELPGLSDTRVSSLGDVMATVAATLTDNGNGTLIVERGFCISSTSEEPTIGDRKVVSTSEGSEFSAKIDELTAGTTYYVRAYVINSKGLAYSDAISFTTRKSAVVSYDNAVDLGLSVKWATYNVGASSPEEYGDYFAWGETKPKSSYTESNSVTYSLSISELKSRGIIGEDGNLVLDYDAANENWGGGWRMPTKDEIKELCNECTWTWTNQNGVEVRKVTGPNGNSIFLPAAGYRYRTGRGDAGSYGYYWSATPYNNGSLMYDLCFYWGSNYNWSYKGSFYGCSVRPVSE